MSEKPKTWERTQVPGLLRNGKSGKFYGRFKIGGKQIWRPLQTDLLTVARRRFADEAVKMERLRAARGSGVFSDRPVRDLAKAYAERLESRSDIRETSKRARRIALLKIEKTWPELAGMKPSQVTPAAVASWVARFKANGTGFVPPGAKAPRRGNSATSVNRAIDTLRGIMALAVEAGVIASNPVTHTAPSGERLKKKITKKALVLPSRADLQRLFNGMENNGAPGGWGREAADLCRFMAFSGARVGEAAKCTWACVDWEKKLFRVPGYKSQSSERIIPLFPDLETLLRALAERRKSAARFAVDGKPLLEAADRLFRLSECQKTIDVACAKLGIQRVTHHDFRHVFATVCIESGVDIPTVSRWLGHADGGALAMKTYGHLRQEHSLAQAAKVIFGGAKQEPPTGELGSAREPSAEGGAK